MKIAMMSAWNTDSGVSVHAELVGREWINMGHSLQIFTFFKHDFHGTTMVGKDEEFVVRCFTTSNHPRAYLDPRPILSADYEIFVVQDLGMLPMDELAKIFYHIKKKVPTVSIVHDNQPSSNPSYYQFDWDRIVCFDQRYEAFLQKVHPADKIQIIPFPCHPVRKGDQMEARKRLGLPLKKKIILIFGQRIKEHLPLFPVIRELNSRISPLVLIVSQKDLDELQMVDGVEMEVRKESPTIEVLYDYLHASDVLILHRNPCEGAVVSSAAFQCLGSGCPILASDSPFFETLKEVVVTYSNLEEFKEMLVELLDKGERYQVYQNAMQGFVKRNSAEVIARQYIDLFQSLREERRCSIILPKREESALLQGMIAS